jgi:H+/gluconate symporter-like permease
LAGEPLLAHWTQTFMGSAARFIMQFFPIFLLGALFGKLMEDSGSVSTIASRPDPRSVAYRLTGHPQARQS